MEASSGQPVQQEIFHQLAIWHGLKSFRILEKAMSKRLVSVSLVAIFCFVTCRTVKCRLMLWIS